MERRRQPRFLVRGAALLTGRDRGSGATLLNLSIGGCAVETSRAVQRGEQLALHLVLSDEEPPLLVEEARVRWISDERVGLEFLRMSEHARGRLHRFLRGRLETVVD